MSWILLVQLLILMFCGGLIVEAVGCALIEKRREKADP